MENKLEEDKTEAQTLIQRCPRRERMETRAKIEGQRKYCQRVFIEDLLSSIGKKQTDLRDIQEVRVAGLNDRLESKGWKKGVMDDSKVSDLQNKPLL